MLNFLFASTILSTIILKFGAFSMSANLDMLEIIACINCGGDVEYIEKPEHLVCKKCGKEYPIINGIPMMGGNDDREKSSEL